MRNYLKFLFQFFCFFIFPLFTVLAQENKDNYQKQVDDYISTLDVSDIKNNILINKSVFTTAELDYYRKPTRNSKGQIIADFKAQDWRSLYERLTIADLRKGNEKIPEISSFIDTDIQKQSKSSIIPIGILNLDATYLNQEQVEKNAKEKKEGKKVTTEKYEKLFFVAASVLQENIYQADVSFRISPALHFSNNNNEIKQVEIDFQDGKGYRAYELKEQNISYRFSSIGERAIGIRLYTKRGTYLFYSRINIKRLERPRKFRDFTITAESVREDTISSKNRLKNGRTSVSVLHGNVRVIYGCDDVLNKPIIVAEGFDLAGSNDLDDLEGYYANALSAFTAQGYDLVLLDYENGRDFIESNAGVLKNLIMQVNSEKMGNEKLIVIGESMSGLIARWALRKMENDGIDHKVKMFISSDSPHQGANIPVSIIQLFRAANPTFITNVFLRIFPSLSTMYSALDSPAATQLLLHYGYPGFTVGVGQPHPEFDFLRTRLNAMGNNGYPQNTEKNVAIINGSRAATDRRLFNNYNYGSNLINLRMFVPGPGQLAYVETYTNQINNNSRILNFWANGLFFSGAKFVNYDTPFNDDFLPGGITTSPIPRRIFFNSSPQFDFCFVPTFSSIDYQGPRATQNDREYLNVNNAQSAGQTRFSAVYGLNNTSTRHTVSGEAIWRSLGVSEGLIEAVPPNTLPNCPQVQPPPIPYFSEGTTPCLPDPSTDPSPITVNLSMLSPTQGQYTHSWSVQPNGYSATGSGDNFNFSASEPGDYTVTCTRSFSSRPALTSTTSLVVTVYPCSIGQNSTNSNCGFLEGDFVYVLNNGQNIYAHFHNGTLYAEANNGGSGQFVSKSTLITNGFFESFAACFAETDPRTGGVNLPFQNGCFTMKSKLSNKMMQMDNDGNGARIRQYNANGQNNQIFKLETVDGDSYKIMAATSNKTIEAPNGGTGYGTELQLWDYNGANHQKWQFVNMNDGSYRLNPKHTNQMVIDVSNNNTNDGNLIHLWGIHNGDNQRFIFQSTGCPNSGCSTPAPNLSASPQTINPLETSNLTASNCAGTVNWSTGAVGAGTSVNPSQTTTYTATCTANGCQSNAGSVTVTVNTGTGSSCSADVIQCSGNQYEVGNYTVNVSTAGTYTLVAYCRSHENPGTIHWSLNGVTQTDKSVPQTNVDQYVEVILGPVSLNANNNTVSLSSAASYLCFKKVCIQGGGNSNCNYNVTANSNISNPSCQQAIELTAGCTGDCGGVAYSWSGNGLSGNQNPINTTAPSSNGNYTYTVTVTKSGCSKQATAGVTVSGCSVSSNCSSEFTQCSGNQSETRTYTVNAGTTGTYTIKVEYTSHESSGNRPIRWSVNGGSTQSTDVVQTGVNQYTEGTLGTVTLNGGNNTITLSSGGVFICFKKVCFQSSARIGAATNDDESIAVSEEKTIQLYPNPTNGKITLRYYLEKGRKASLQFMNLSGSVVTLKALIGVGGWQEDQTDLSNQPNGSYLLLFESDKRVITRKFIIVK